MNTIEQKTVGFVNRRIPVGNTRSYLPQAVNGDLHRENGPSISEFPDLRSRCVRPVPPAALPAHGQNF